MTDNVVNGQSNIKLNGQDTGKYKANIIYHQNNYYNPSNADTILDIQPKISDWIRKIIVTRSGTNNPSSINVWGIDDNNGKIMFPVNSMWFRENNIQMYYSNSFNEPTLNTTAGFLSSPQPDVTVFGSLRGKYEMFLFNITNIGTYDTQWCHENIQYGQQVIPQIREIQEENNWEFDIDEILSNGGGGN